MVKPLNIAEKTVLDHLVVLSSYNGHDFGCMEDAEYGKLGLTGKQFSGFCSQLAQKGYIDCNETIKVGGKPVTQFTLTDEAKSLCKLSLND